MLLQKPVFVLGNAIVPFAQLAREPTPLNIDAQHSKTYSAIYTNSMFNRSRPGKDM